jgi:hypothetical protein
VPHPPEVTGLVLGVVDPWLVVEVESVPVPVVLEAPVAPFDPLSGVAAQVCAPEGTSWLTGPKKATCIMTVLSGTWVTTSATKRTDGSPSSGPLSHMAMPR